MHALFTNGRGKEPSSSNKILKKRKLNKHTTSGSKNTINNCNCNIILYSWKAFTGKCV